MLAIRLPPDLESRLSELAERTGRTKTYCAREAIERHLDDLEDLYLAERELAKVRAGRSKPMPLAEVMKAHGLEGRDIGRDAQGARQARSGRCAQSAEVPRREDRVFDESSSPPQSPGGSELGNFWRWCVGDLRLVAELQDQTVTVLVVRVGRRDEVYR